MKKFSFLWIILICSAFLLTTGCETKNNNQDNDENSLPDNKVTSIVKDFAKEIWANYSDIKEEEFERYNYADENKNDYTINW